MYRDVDLGSYLPDFIHDYREIGAICEAENPELNLMWDELENMMNDMFFDSLTIRGCSRWEKMLKLTVGATDTLQERRFRIKNAVTQNQVYSYRGVKDILNVLCGQGAYTFSVDVDNFQVAVQLELTVAKMYSEVIKTLEKIIPLNMGLNVELRYNQHKDYYGKLHSKLKQFTHEQLRNEVVTIV